MKTAWYLAAILGTQTTFSLPADAQRQQAPGHSIGTVSTGGNLILMTLDEGALGKANLFDLAGRTLRFTPEKGGYRVENLALQWDSQFGPEMNGAQAALHRFAFPFSGKEWDSFSVGVTGSIAFGAPPGGPGRGGRGGGISVERFAQLQDAGPALIDTVPPSACSSSRACRVHATASPIAGSEAAGPARNTNPSFAWMYPKAAAP